MEKSSPFGIYEKNGELCSLKEIKYLLEVKDFVLKTTIVQEFENKRNQPVELVYRFADSKNRTVNFVQVELYDPIRNIKRVLRAQIEEKLKAQERYDDAIAEGNTAMLAEKDKDDRVTLQIGNVSQKTQISVRMESVEEVNVEKRLSRDIDTNNCVFKISIPSLNYSGGQFSEAIDNISVRCRANIRCGKLSNLGCPSHIESFESNLEEGLIFTKKRINFNRDVDIEIHVEDIPLVSGIMEERKNGKWIAAVNLIPHFDTKFHNNNNIKIVQTEIILIVDCSGSMSGNRIKRAKKALYELIKEVYHNKIRTTTSNVVVKMNIIRFGSDFECLYPNEPQKLDKNTYREMKMFIKNEIEANLGGTNILNPIIHVLEQEVEFGFTRQVFFFTDGEDRDTERIIDYVSTQQNDTRKPATRFFCFGIGRNINPVLLNRIAQITHGRAVYVQESSEIQNAVLEQIDFAIQPSIRDIDVSNFLVRRRGNYDEDSTNKKVDFVPVCERDNNPSCSCYNLQKLSLFYFLEEKVDSCDLEYTICGKKVKHRIPLQIHDSSPFETTTTNNNRYILGSIATKKRVNELCSQSSSNFSGNREEIEKEIRDLGLEYNFLTSQTSFIMVAENNEESVLDEIVSEQIEVVQRKKFARKSDNYNNPDGVKMIRRRTSQLIGLGTSIGDQQDAISDDEIANRLFADVFRIQDDNADLVESLLIRADHVFSRSSEINEILSSQNETLLDISDDMDHITGIVGQVRREIFSFLWELMKDKLFLICCCFCILCVVVAVSVLVICKLGVCVLICKSLGNKAVEKCKGIALF